MPGKYTSIIKEEILHFNLGRWAFLSWAAVWVWVSGRVSNAKETGDPSR